MPRGSDDRKHTHAFQDLLHECNRHITVRPPKLLLKSASQGNGLSKPHPCRNQNSIFAGSRRPVSTLDLIHSTARDLPGLSTGWWSDRTRPRSRNETAQPREPQNTARPITARPSTGRQYVSPLHSSSSPSQSSARQESDGDSISTKSSLLATGTHSDKDELLHTRMQSIESLYFVLGPLFAMGIKPGLNSVMEQTRHCIRALLGCQDAAVYLCEKDGVRRDSPEAKPIGTRGIVDLALRGEDEVVSFLKGQSNEAANHGFRGDEDSAILASVVIDPEGRKVGVIVAGAKTGGGESFNSNDEGVIRLISMQLGMLIALCKQMSSNSTETKPRARSAHYVTALNACTSLREIEELVKDFVKAELGAETSQFLQRTDRHGNAIDSHGGQPVNRALTGGQVVVIDDLRMDPENRVLSDNLGRVSSPICLPIRCRTSGKVVGAVQALHSKPLMFSKRQAARLEDAMEQTTFALERQQKIDISSALQSRLPEIFASSDIMATALTAEAIAVHFLRAKHACVYVTNRTRGTVWIVNGDGEGEKELDQSVTSKCLLGDCIRTKKISNYKNARRENKFVECIDAAKSQRFPRDPMPLLLVPIRSPMNRSEILAVLGVTGAAGEGFSALDQETAETIAISIGGALDNCMRHEIAEVALADVRGMLRVAAEIHHTMTLHELARAVIDGAEQSLSASSVRVVVREDAELKRVRVLSVLEGALQDEVVTSSDDALLRRSLQEGVLVNADSEAVLDDMGYARLHCIAAAPQTTSGRRMGPTMLCPLFTGLDHGRVLGAVQVERASGAAVFSRGDETKLQYLCQQASPAFKRAVDSEGEQQAITSMAAGVRQYRRLCETLPELTRQKDTTEIDTAIISAATTVIPCGHASLLRVVDSNESDSPKFVVSTQVGAHTCVQTYDAGTGFPGHVLQVGSAAVCNDLAASSTFDPVLDATPNNGGAFRNAVGSTIRDGGKNRVLAVLVLYNKIPTGGDASVDFSEAEAEMLRMLADCAAICMSNSLQCSQLLGSLGTLLSSDLSWQHLHEACSIVVGCEHLAVLMMSDSDDGMRCVHPPFAVGEEVNVGCGLLSEVRSYRRAIRVVDSATDR